MAETLLSTAEYGAQLALGGAAASICVVTFLALTDLLHRARSRADGARLGRLIGISLATAAGTWTALLMIAITRDAAGASLFQTVTLALALGYVVAASCISVALAVSDGGRRSALAVAALLGLAAYLAGGAFHAATASMVWASVSLAGAVVAAAAGLWIGLAKPIRTSALAAAVLSGAGLLGPHVIASLGEPGTGGARTAVDHLLHGAAIGLAVASLAILVCCGVAGLFDRYLRRDGEGGSEAQRLASLANASFEGIAVSVDGLLIEANSVLLELLGLPAEKVLGTSVLDHVHPDDHDRVRGALASGMTEPYEIEIVNAHGVRIPVEVLGRNVTYDGRQARVTAVRDIRERIQAEEKIRHLASTDALTNLPNRALLRELLVQKLARAQHSGEMVAVLSINIDRFTSVNAHHGHDKGDELLRSAARCFTSVVSPNDIVGRVGGDEFVIIQPGQIQPEGAGALARRLAEAFAKEAGHSGADLNVDLSIGIAISPYDGEEATRLMNSCEVALRKVREEGGGTFRFYEPALDERLEKHREIERELRRAISENELSVRYQPQASITTGRVTGFEALLRWEHPERGFISPAEFIPVAEDKGLIGPVGEFVLREACREAASWPTPLRVGVNLSVKQFETGDIATLIEEVLTETELAPSRLEIEITESVLIRDCERALITLHKLKSLGVRIAMDDFGTGFSSLSYIQRFPLDKIKIDRSFVTGVDSNRGSLAIVRAIIGLGKTLGLDLIAEGVETEAELAVLAREGCEECQGYLLSKAVTPAEIPDAAARQYPHGGAKLHLVGDAETANGPYAVPSVS